MAAGGENSLNSPKKSCARAGSAPTKTGSTRRVIIIERLIATVTPLTASRPMAHLPARSKRGQALRVPPSQTGERDGARWSGGCDCLKGPAVLTTHFDVDGGPPATMARLAHLERLRCN